MLQSVHLINMKNLNFIVTLTVLFLAACNGATNSDEKSSAQPIAFIDTLQGFKKEIPTYDNGGLDLFYLWVKEKQKQLGLDSLENGFENLQIRLWYDSSRILGRKLVVITNRDTNWSAKVYNMKVIYDGENEKIFVFSTKQVSPKSGWPIFSKKLLDLQVLTLPDMYAIPDLVDNWKDGEGYAVEVATKMQYRFYTYHMPREFQAQYWQAKNLVEVLDLLAEELNV